MSNILADQRLLVGVILLMSSAGKAIASEAEIGNTAFAALMGKLVPGSGRAITPTWRLLVGIEAALAGLLFASVAPMAVGGLAIAFFAVATVYLVWGMRRRAEMPCGCFGSASIVSRRSIIRTELLGAAMVAYVASSYTSVLVASWAVASLLILETSAVIVVSDELRPTARRLRLALARIGRLIGVATTDYVAVRKRLESQPFWQELVERTGRPPEFVTSWRDGRWYLTEYKLSLANDTLTVIGGEFVAVHPPWMRVVVAREESDGSATLLAAWDSARAAFHSRAEPRQESRSEAAVEPVTT